MANNMSIGNIGDNQLIFKRKFRWVMSLGDLEQGGSDEMWYCRVSSRPTLNFEETEVHYLHERHFIVGKTTWDSVTITIYDVAGGNGVPSQEVLRNWLSSVYQGVADGKEFTMGDTDIEYKITLAVKKLCAIHKCKMTNRIHPFNRLFNRIIISYVPF